MKNRNKIIILNGTSSAGKTTLAKVFQNTNDEFYYYFSMDNIYTLLAEKYMICTRHADCDKKFSNKLTEENKKGFYFEQFNLKTGEYANMMKKDYWVMLEVLIKNGRNVIVDMVIYGLDELKYIASFFKDYENIYLVRVFCELEELNRREASRGNRMIGSAENTRYLIDTAYNDYVVDTTSKSPEELVGELKDFIDNNESCGLKRIRKDFNL